MTLAAWAGMAATSFVAALLLATNGFGFAVLAVPFFLIFAPAGEAIRLIVILSLGISLAMMPRLRDAVDVALLLRLVVGSIAGLPVGLVLFALSDQRVVRAAAGAVIVIFAAMVAWHRYRGVLGRFAMRPAGDVAIGTVAGAATGLVGMPGPPLIVYLMLAAAPMRSVRATLIWFFALVYAATVLADAVFIGIPGVDWLIAASLMPLAWIGGVVGLRVADRLPEPAAVVLSVAVLVVAGVYTLAAAVGLALW